MSGLTPEQLAQIERNRQEAIRKRAASLSAQAGTAVSRSPSVVVNSFYGATNKPASATFSTATKSGSACLNGVGSSRPVSTTSTSFDSAQAKEKSTLLGYFNSKQRSTTSTAVVSKPTDGRIPLNIKATSSAQLQASHSFGSRLLTGTFRLISRERFIVDIGYHQKTIEIFKTIPSAIYDSNNKRWNFHLRDYANLLAALQVVSSQVSITSLPKFVLKSYKDSSLASKPPTDLNLSRIDPVLVNSLMPFQREGICFAIWKHGRCLIADDMGLGKTIQALGIAHYYKEDWPLLIVTPSSVRFTWEDAIASWLPSVPHHHILVMTSGKDYVRDARILIVSYDLLKRHEEEIKKTKFGVVIIDESHFLKSLKTARTKAGLNLIKCAKRVLLLSGTPALSRPVELFSQISAIDSQAFGSFHDYGIRYCDGKKGTFGWDFSGSSNMEELQIVLEARFMIRRLKTDVMSQLPEKNRQMIILSSDKIDTKAKQMKSFEKMLCSRDLKGMERRGTLMEYYATTGTAKIAAISDYIADLLECDKKFLCFAHHRNVMDALCSVIEKKKYKFIRIDGSTNPKIRQDLCDSFQGDPDIRVAVLSITAANAGITLTAANLVVFAELFWNPGILTQAEDRAHRIGQRDSVMIQYLVAKGTADDHLWPLIIQKLDVLNRAGLSKDNFQNSHSVQLKSSSKQTTMESYFDELVDDDSWLADINLDNIEIPDCDTEIPEKKAKLSS